MKNEPKISQICYIHKRLIIFILFAFTFLIGSAQRPYKTLYVDASQPNDSGNGLSWRTAKKTIHGVKREIRKYNRKMKGDIEVIIKGGTYYTGRNTFLFGEPDSGFNGHQIIYRNADNEKVVFSGGRRLNLRWKRYNNNFYYARKNYQSNLRTLYVNGKRSQIARTPFTAKQAKAVIKRDASGKIIAEQCFFKIPIQYLPAWSGHHPVEMMINHYWTFRHFRIRKVVRVGQEAHIYPRNPDLNFKRFNNIFLKGEFSFSFINSGNFFHQGQFYDADGDNINYSPRVNENINSAVVIAPVLEQILKLQGSKSKPVHDISFYGINFNHSNYEKINQSDIVGGQAGVLEDGVLPAAVHLENANHITFEKCVFEKLAADALSLNRNVSQCNIIGNYIGDIGGGGISIFNGTQSKGLHNSFEFEGLVHTNIIAQNLIEGIGIDYPGSVGIWMVYGSWNLIKNNTLRHLPYSGISIGWGWGQHNAAPIQGNRVASNHIHNVMGQLVDGGGIYTLDDQDDNTGNRLEIFENYIHNLHRSGLGNKRSPIVGLYLDQGSNSIAVQHNVYQAIPDNGSVPDPWFHSLVFNQSDINNLNMSIPQIIAHPNTDLIYDKENTSDPYVRNHAGRHREYHQIASPKMKKSVNVALNATVTASSSLGNNDNFNPQKGVDGNINTIWHTSNNSNGNTWYQIDLHRKYPINRVVITARQNMNQPEARSFFRVLASNDPKFRNHVVLGNVGAVPFDNKGKAYFNVNNRVFRYLRIVKRPGKPLFNFAELEVFSNIKRTNVATNARSYASSVFNNNYNFYPNRAFDDDINSIWASNGNDKSPTIGLDMYRKYPISRIELVARKDINQAISRSNFEVRASNDHSFSTYEVIGKIGNKPFPHKGKWAINVSSTKPYRLIRVVKTDGKHFNIAELNVFTDGSVNNGSSANQVRNEKTSDSYISEKEVLKIYPVPSKSFVYLDFKSNDTIRKVVLRDYLGRIVKEFPSSTNKIDISNMNQGLYFLEVFTTNGKTFKKKILKQ
ncbi:hypothetical protein GCM10009430_32140 [Aquimarina litoralis]|uniref:F5/8 type C domain-containing protein n=1 Tax=Aquimarina litoralis TaxID=584605 RepID=A0ABP3UBM3_9FLAO